LPPRAEEPQQAGDGDGDGEQHIRQDDRKRQLLQSEEERDRGREGDQRDVADNAHSSQWAITAHSTSQFNITGLRVQAVNCRRRLPSALLAALAEQPLGRNKICTFTGAEQDSLLDDAARRTVRAPLNTSRA
jgi:hypothetical protein